MRKFTFYFDTTSFIPLMENFLFVKIPMVKFINKHELIPKYV